MIGCISTPLRVGRDITMSTDASFHSIRLSGMLSGQPVKFRTNRGLSGQDYVNRLPYGPYRDIWDSTLPYWACFSTSRGLSGRASVNRVHFGSYRGFFGVPNIYRVQSNPYQGFREFLLTIRWVSVHVGAFRDITMSTECIPAQTEAFRTRLVRSGVFRH